MTACKVCEDTGRVAIWVYDADGVGWDTRPCSAPSCAAGATERSAYWYEGGATMEPS